MEKIKIKALSVNVAWQGKRFKTRAYLAYEQHLMYLLPRIEVPKWELSLFIRVWISKLSDIDNPLKPLLDIMQKKYDFNDKNIMLLQIEKVVVKKWEEFIQFKFEKYPC